MPVVSSASLSESMRTAGLLDVRDSTFGRPTVALKISFAATTQLNISLTPASILTDCVAKHLVNMNPMWISCQTNGSICESTYRAELLKFYVGTAEQPVLIVRDLKHGPDAHGTVGLFVGVGTEGHFRNLSIHPQ